MEDAGGAGAAGSEPGVAPAKEGEAGIAGGEGSFVGQRPGRIAALPSGAGVIGSEDFGAAVQLVPDYDAALRIPESDGVEKTFGVRVGGSNDQRSPASVVL